VVVVVVGGGICIYVQRMQSEMPIEACPDVIGGNGGQTSPGTSHAALVKEADWLWPGGRVTLIIL